MASSKWKSFGELIEINLSRSTIIWGASNWVERTLNLLPKNYKVECIVDNNKNNQGVKYLNYKVKNPTFLNSKKKKPFVLICTGSYFSVIKDLEKLNYVMGIDYSVTPLLQKRAFVDKFLSSNHEILFTSPEHNFEKNKGGGLYKLDTKSNKVEKVISGKFRGITKFKEGYIVNDMLMGAKIYDKNFKLIKIIKLKKNCEAHGNYFCPFDKKLYVAQPGRDSIGIYNLNKNSIEEIFISSKWKKNKKDNHHINDLYVNEHSIFVSMFSLSGNWMNDVYDGSIIEISKKTKKITGVLSTNLWMPHSVNYINNSICYVDSMKGNVVTSSHNVISNLDGFIRGLDFKDGYFFTALSQHRYPEKLIGKKKNISLDCGIVKIDPENGFTKFFQIENTNSIHSLIVL